VNPLVQQYRIAAEAHGKCTYSSVSSNATNAAFARLQVIFQRLVMEGDDRELLELYDDKDSWVQIWAASHTLEIEEERASAKLQELATTRYGLTRATAQLTLQEWRLGNLRLRNGGLAK
jgi:Domain of unknown function (DUF2019)